MEFTKKAQVSGAKFPQGALGTLDAGSFLAIITNQVRPAGGCLY